MKLSSPKAGAKILNLREFLSVILTGIHAGNQYDFCSHAQVAFRSDMVAIRSC
jgi:hypothetical protein